ncbi:hypothetical protein H0H81_006916 [Sphagnurus paluster]|uniref:Beta-glucuronidase C-terminal domain-containing protein n=1 Tax=Sphagnurus paluster TaxID=117069 RepID=A0A9P7GLD4_9AGAR|nr:hypothetical protein H0H81_006916 [Sphagnurus paluster]
MAGTTGGQGPIKIVELESKGSTPTGLFVSMAQSTFHKLSTLILLAIVANAATVDVAVPLKAPSGAPTLSPSLTSFSIEGDRWTDWSGTTSRNQFFYNALDNLKQITGAPPKLRIGADSEDHTQFRANINVRSTINLILAPLIAPKFQEAVFPDSTAITPYPEATKLVVGDSYYATTRFLPAGTQVTWGVNLGSDNKTATYLATRSIVKAFQLSSLQQAGISLEHIEIGNEPDAFAYWGYRPNATWNVAAWVADWTNFAKNVSATVPITPISTTKFMSGSFATLSLGFSPSKAYAAGLLNSKPGQHLYSGAFCNGGDFLLQSLMDKTTIRSNLTTLIPDIQNTHAKGLQYVLGETNSYACHGAPGVSNTAGASLWQLDYTLHAYALASIGISNLYFHQGVGYKYNMIQPVTLTVSSLTGEPLATPQAPHIQPQYYSAIIVAEAIGKSTNTRIVELDVNHPSITGYAFYSGSKLERAVFINLKGYFSTSTSRTKTTIDLGFAGKGSPAALMTVKRLAIKYATDVSGLTWGGQNYESANARVAGKLSLMETTVSQGVQISDSEAILIQF